MSRRKDNGPPATGPLISLRKEKSVFDDHHAAPAPAPIEEDDDFDEDELILSQTSLKERIFGSQSSSKQSNDPSADGAGSSAAPAPAKRKSRRNTTSPRNATPRKRRTQSPVQPQRTSKRIASFKSKPYYKDPSDTVDLKPIANTDDEDFAPSSGGAGGGASSTGRGRKPGRKRGRPVGSGSRQRQRERYEDDADDDADDDDVRGTKSVEPLKINFSPKRVKKKRSRGPGAGLTEEERRETEWEILRRKGCTSDEVTICMNYFRDKYKRPVNNAQGAYWFRQEHGRDPTMDELHDLFETYFKPWSDKVYDLQYKFSTFIHDAKANKPKNINPKVTDRDAKKWIAEFYQIHGPIPVPEIPERFRRKKSSANTSNTDANVEAENEIKSEPEPGQDLELKNAHQSIRPRRRRSSRRRNAATREKDDVRPVESVNSPIAVTLRETETGTATSSTRRTTRSATRKMNKAGNVLAANVNGNDEEDDDQEDGEESLKKVGTRSEKEESVVVSEDKVREEMLPAAVVTNSKASSSKLLPENVEVENHEDENGTLVVEADVAVEEVDVIEPANAGVNKQVIEVDGDMRQDDEQMKAGKNEMNVNSRLRSNDRARPFSEALERDGKTGVIAMDIEVKPALVKKGIELVVDCRNRDTTAVDANINAANADAPDE